MKILILLLLTSLNAQAFYLMTNTGAAFSQKEVSIYVTSNSTCTNAGLSNTQLLDIAVDGANKFWNRVPTADIKVKRGGILQTSDNNFLTEKLCVHTSEAECPALTSVPKVSDIVISCNNNTTDNFIDSSYLAISAPTTFSSNDIKGSVILINDSASTTVNTLSNQELTSLLAHEIGHALGLAHTDKTQALMYSKNSGNHERLAQDDIRGISYLYPNKLSGCGGLFGTIDMDPKNDGRSPLTDYLKKFSISLILGLSLGLFIFCIRNLLYNFRAQSNQTY